jgi:hypothetical protein
MKLNSKSKSLLALVLAIAIATTGCSAQSINIALQDLPVLTQMALNSPRSSARLLRDSKLIPATLPWSRISPRKPAAA